MDNEEIRISLAIWFADKQVAVERYSHISKWNVSNVTDMSELFRGWEEFNEDISQWDVSNVYDMSVTFNECLNFNQP